MLPGGPTEFTRIIRLLTEANCDFVVIGGLASQLHGGYHLTEDLDIAINRIRDNARAIASVLAPFHPKPRQWQAGLSFVWDDQTIMNSTGLTLECDLGWVGLLAEPEGAPAYKDLRAHAKSFDLDGRTIYYASIPDLINMKRAAGRQKDLGHIAELETIQRLLDEDETKKD